MRCGQETGNVDNGGRFPTPPFPVAATIEQYAEEKMRLNVLRLWQNCSCYTSEDKGLGFVMGDYGKMSLRSRGNQLRLPR